MDGTKLRFLDGQLRGSTFAITFSDRPTEH